MSDLVGVYTLPGYEFRVEVSVGPEEGTLDLYDEALYDTAVYSGIDLYWVSLATRLYSFSSNRGRDRFADAFRPGSFVFTVDNDDLLFNPDHGNASIGAVTLRPGRYVRLSGRSKTSQDYVVMFVGKIDGIHETYTAGAAGSSTRFTCSDLSAALAREVEPALTTPIGDGEISGQRVERILEQSGYPVSILRPISAYIDPGTIVFQASDGAGSSLTELERCAKSEGGAFFFQRDGLYPRFRQAGWLDDTTPILVVGRDGDPARVVGASGMAWDSSRVVNDVQLSREGGPLQRSIATGSQGQYGRRTFARDDLYCKHDADVYELTEQIIADHQYDRGRLERVDLAPATAEGAEQLFALEVGEVITVHVESLRGWGYSITAYLNRIEHTGAVGGDYVCKLTLDNVERGNPQEGGDYDVDYAASYNVNTPTRQARIALGGAPGDRVRTIGENVLSGTATNMHDPAAATRWVGEGSNTNPVCAWHAGDSPNERAGYVTAEQLAGTLSGAIVLEEREPVTAGELVRCWLVSRFTANTGGNTAQVRFYDAAVGGTLIETVALGDVLGQWTYTAATVTVPTGATHAELLLSVFLPNPGLEAYQIAAASMITDQALIAVDTRTLPPPSIFASDIVNGTNASVTVLGQGFAIGDGELVDLAGTASIERLGIQLATYTPSIVGPRGGGVDRHGTQWVLEGDAEREWSVP